MEGGGAGVAGSMRLETGRTRAEWAEWLVELGAETPRMVVGIDCCFSYPAWFLAEHGCGSVFDFWRAVVGDATTTATAAPTATTAATATAAATATRAARTMAAATATADAMKAATTTAKIAGMGEEWLHRACEDGRFWGVTGPGRTGKRPEEFSGEGLRRMMRTTDWENKIAVRMAGGDAERAEKMKGITAKSPFQIGGSGSVGTGSLRAMPVLERLREAGFRVWPFEDVEFGEKAPRPLLVEMYTRLLTGPVAKSNGVARRAYLLAKRKTDALYAGLGRGVLAKAYASEDAFDALVSCVEMVRWRGEFAGLKATRDEVLRLEGITWRPGVR
ncbi:MAG TPA: hypothetical protein VGU46_04270 [Acidobacteriaceae bacterium]|nr:hypothetical protein [Acidobacteriaceae bacterium]